MKKLLFMVSELFGSEEQKVMAKIEDANYLIQEMGKQEINPITDRFIEKIHDSRTELRWRLFALRGGFVKHPHMIERQKSLGIVE